jgi:hypothetical protein
MVSPLSTPTEIRRTVTDSHGLLRRPETGINLGLAIRRGRNRRWPPPRPRTQSIIDSIRTELGQPFTQRARTRPPASKRQGRAICSTSYF